MSVVTKVQPMIAAVKNVVLASTIVLALTAVGTWYVLFQDDAISLVKPITTVDPTVLEEMGPEMAAEPNVIEMKRAIEAINSVAEGMRARTE